MSKPESANAELVSLFTRLGLTKAKAEEATKSPQSSAILKELIESNPRVAAGADEKKAKLLSSLSIALSKTSGFDVDKRDYAVNAILDSRLITADQLSGICSLA
jgi:glutaminyl-tRNA synthetase